MAGRFTNNTKENRMRIRSSSVLATAIIGLLALAPGLSNAQEIEARTIRFGHLNNTDHPISAGVKKFAEIVQFIVDCAVN